MLQSKGIKRALSIFFLALSGASEYVEELRPFKDVLFYLGSALGVVGVGHATLQRR